MFEIAFEKLDAFSKYQTVKVECSGYYFYTPQKDKVVKDKKEDKKNKGKAKESTEPEANEENHSENGEAKSNAVHFAHSFYLLRVQ